MRILCISDIHGSDAALDNVLQFCQDYSPDLLIACGDITNFGPGRWARRFFDKVPIPSLAIPGNCDPADVLTEIEASKAVLLHKRKYLVDDIPFVGLGGSISTPTEMTPLELSESEILESLEEVMVPDAVLVVHSPAKGHLDWTATHRDLGSDSILQIVNRYSPRLVLSGHIHEGRGVECDQGTTFVNPGPASRGYAAIIDLNSTIEAKLIHVK